MAKPNGLRKEWEGYSVESLHNGIRASEVNVTALKDAISRELKMQTEYRWMIDAIERKKEEAIVAKTMQEQVNKSIKEQNEAFLADAVAKGFKVTEKTLPKEEEEDADSS